jgi:ribosomal protein S18 acetylase RimI-like enzyme
MEETRAGAASEGGERPSVRLRPVTPFDAEFLVRVYASTRADELALVPWNEEQKDAFIRQQAAAQRQEYEARFPDAEYSVIVFGEQPAGRIWVGRDSEQIRLLDIALLPEFQNRGIGAALIRELAAEAAQERKPLRHMVFKFNTAALRFYERLGFTQLEDTGAYLHMEYRPAGDGPRPSSPISATESDD